MLANDIVGFHTRSYRWNFLQCCRDLMGLEVDFERGVVEFDGREVWVRAYPLPIDSEATRRVAASDRTLEFEAELKRRRREHLILRVDRADLSKNVLRGFTAFDQFLDEHPEFLEKVTFIAQLMPSRMDVEQYQDYLQRIEALVAVVNHRHGTPDWMPIQLKLRDNLEEAVAAYKNYDVMIVNAMFDGMNLVAKEGPLVNERDGVSILSENTGAHEELGEFALSVNPFDIKETADSIYAALTMDAEERARRSRGPEGGGHRARPRRLDRRPARRHPLQARRRRRARVAPRAGRGARLAARRAPARLGRAAGPAQPAPNSGAAVPASGDELGRRRRRRAAARGARGSDGRRRGAAPGAPAASRRGAVRPRPAALRRAALRARRLRGASRARAAASLAARRRASLGARRRSPLARLLARARAPRASAAPRRGRASAPAAPRRGDGDLAACAGSGGCGGAAGATGTGFAGRQRGLRAGSAAATRRRPRRARRARPRARRCPSECGRSAAPGRRGPYLL